MRPEVIEFFIEVNKAESYLHRLKIVDNSSYKKIKFEAASLNHTEMDEAIFDCMFSEDPRMVRYVMATVDTSDVDSSFEKAKRNIEGMRLRFWRDVFRGDVEVDPVRQLLYLNYFTLFAGRTGGFPNKEMLEKRDYLDDVFVREKLLAKLLNFNSQAVSSQYTLNIIRQGDSDRVLLENSNAYLEKQISALYGGNQYVHKA